MIKSTAAAVVAAVLLMCCSCSCSLLGGGARLKAGCGVVIDGSGSSDAKRGFDVRKLLNEQLTHVLYEDKCRYVVFAPISGASQASPCTHQMIDVDPDVTGTVQRTQLQGSKRAEAVSAALGIQNCIRHDPRSVGGSDVFGGLMRIAATRPAEAPSYRLIVFSDFVNSGGDRPGAINLKSIDLSTARARGALLDRLAKEGKIPDLSKDRLTAYGYGVMQSTDPEKFAGFDAFWRELIHVRAKCPDLPSPAS
jgi:hypothetical protein